MAALANLLLFGKEGYADAVGPRRRNGRGAARELIESHPNLTVLNGDNVGPVTLFRVYPDGVDTFSVKDRERSDPSVSRAVAQLQRVQPADLRARARRGAGRPRRGDLLTNCYRTSDFGTPIVALKSYVLSPFADEDRMTSIIDHVLEARDAVQREWECG